MTLQDRGWKSELQAVAKVERKKERLQGARFLGEINGRFDASCAPAGGTRVASETNAGAAQHVAPESVHPGGIECTH